jgi:hypothetical protein
MVGEEEKDGRIYQVIELKPSEDKSYSLVILNVDKKMKRFHKIEIQDKSGNSFTYNVNEFIPEAPYKESDFTFTEQEFPGAEVIDMR